METKDIRDLCGKVKDRADRHAVGVLVGGRIAFDSAEVGAIADALKYAADEIERLTKEAGAIRDMLAPLTSESAYDAARRLRAELASARTQIVTLTNTVERGSIAYGSRS